MTNLADKIDALAEKATKGKWQADNFLCDGDHALRIGEPWRNGQPLATIAHVEHNWNDCGPHDRRISWKEAEANAALIVELVNARETIIRALRDAERMREALKAHDAKAAECPVDAGKFRGIACGKCGAMPSEDCIVKARAADAFVNAARQALGEPRHD